MQRLEQPKLENITLYFQEGASDKVYQCSIVPVSVLTIDTFGLFLAEELGNEQVSILTIDTFPLNGHGRARRDAPWLPVKTVAPVLIHLT